MALNLCFGPGRVGAITCYANGTITAGDFVKAIANDDSVTSSGLSSWAGNEIKVERCDAAGDEESCIGIAGDDASSGDLITVYNEGIFIVRAGEAIVAGTHIKKADSTDYLEVEEVDNAADTYYNAGSGGKPIGTALTSSSAADAYLIILLRV